MGSRDDHIKKGDDYMAKGKLKEAIVEYSSAIQVDGRYGPARQKLGEALLKDKNPMKAYRELVNAADLMPDDIPAQLRAGEVLLQVAQFEDAKTRADKVLAKDPKNVDAFILKGNALAGLKDLKGAFAALGDAIRTDPTRGEGYTHLGTLQFVQGDMARAEAEFKRAIAADPKSVPARLALANLYWSTSRRPEAETAIKEANALDPTNVLPNQALAMMYLGSGRMAEAEEPLKAVAKYDDGYEGKILLADYYANVRRLPEAKALYEQVAAGTDGVPTAKLRLASLGLLEGDKASAYRLIDEILAANSTNVEALVAKGQLLFSDGKADEALVSVRKAVTANPSSPLAHFVLGDILRSRYELDDATAAYKDALRASSSFAPANVALAKLSLNGGRFAEAARYAQAAIDSVPGLAEAYLLLAQAQVVAGNASAAEAPIRLLTTAFPDSPAVQAELGRLLMAKGDKAGATSAFARALKKDALQPTAVEGMVILDVQQKKNADARKRLDAAIAASPNDTNLQLMAARLYATAFSDAAASEAMLKRVLGTDANNLAAFEMLARLYIQTKNLPAATVEFEKLAQRQPTSVANQTAVGLLQQLQNNPDEARTRYEKALALDPRAPVAANNLAQIYVDRGENLDVALNLAQTAKAGLPNSHEVDDTLGWIYYKKGNGPMAVASMRQAVGAQPENAVYLYHLGAAYALNKDKANARATLEKALKIQPAFPGADDARKILSSLN
ncbi:MAG TPA: tetratricopeptide repeat protein [Vicinamibacterales bacterium]|nr:tetratricopeptide repeat protein [Vicinamibacterales bacterium]